MLLRGYKNIGLKFNNLTTPYYKDLIVPRKNNKGELEWQKKQLSSSMMMKTSPGR